jgi:hypothetical protein
VKRPVLIGGIAAVVVVVLAVVVACSLHGSDKGTAQPPTSTTASTAPTDPATTRAMTREELQAAVFGGDVGSTTVLGQVDGAVYDSVDPHPARIEVTEVTAFATSTLVRFTLVNLKDDDPLLSLEAFNRKTPLTHDIRDVAIVDTAGQQRYEPYVGVSTSDKTVSLCTCAASPLGMSEVGQPLSATFPPIDPSATTLSLDVPGFPEIKDLPVTRR